MAVQKEELFFKKQLCFQGVSPRTAQGQDKRAPVCPPAPKATQRGTESPIPWGRGCRGGSGAAGAQDGRCSQAFPSRVPPLSSPPAFPPVFPSLTHRTCFFFLPFFSFLGPKRPTPVLLWKAPPQTMQTKPKKMNPNGVIQAKQPQKKSLGAGGSGDRAVPTSTLEPCTAPAPKKHLDGTRGRNTCPVSSPGEDKAR